MSIRISKANHWLHLPPGLPDAVRQTHGVVRGLLRLKTRTNVGGTQGGGNCWEESVIRKKKDRLNALKEVDQGLARSWKKPLSQERNGLKHSFRVRLTLGGILTNSIARIVRTISQFMAEGLERYYDSTLLSVTLGRIRSLRYQYLSTEDLVTKMVKHQFRGRHGRLLTPYELEVELPKFIDVQFVDIGEKVPFYDE